MRRIGSSRSLRLPRRPWQTLLLIVLVVALLAVRQWRPDLFERTAPPASVEAGVRRVERVVDGDTLLLADPKEKIRLIGANTPETVKPNSPVEPWGPEASAFTKKFVAGGEVRLQFDGDAHDKYGRTLALVWVGDRMLNEELLRAGLARAELKYHYSAEHKKQFQRAEAEARNAKRGIWSE
jgi:micrococcal nuclease